MRCWKNAIFQYFFTQWPIEKNYKAMFSFCSTENQLKWINIQKKSFFVIFWQHFTIKVKIFVKCIFNLQNFLNQKYLDLHGCDGF